MFARFAAVLTVLLLAASPAFAAMKDAVLNKEGYWSIDVDGDSCAGSMTLQGGSVFLLRGHQGDVLAALFSRTPLPKGKTLSLEADGQSIDLPASFSQEHTVVFLDGVLDATSLKTLREARQLRVLVDGQAVAAMTLEGTGFPGAIDSLIACSRGQSGWWGKGVKIKGAAPPAQPTEPAKPVKFAYNAEDVWMLTPLEDAGTCFAQASTDDEDRLLQFVQEGGAVTIAVLSPGPPLPRGRKGEVVLDAGSFNFKPGYDGKTYMMLDGALTDEALELLKATKRFGLRVDGKMLVDGNLEGTGFPKILDELAACARGETGWWTPKAAGG